MNDFVTAFFSFFISDVADEIPDKDRLCDSKENQSLQRRDFTLRSCDQTVIAIRKRKKRLTIAAVVSCAFRNRGAAALLS